MSEAAGRSLLTGSLAGLAAGALWGLVFVAPRMVAGYSSLDLTAGRFAACGVVAALVMLLVPRTRSMPTPGQALAALGLSALGATGYYLLLVMAIRDAGTEVPALIIGTIPLWLMVLGKPRGLRWHALLPGLALTVAGLALMTAPSLSDLAAGRHFVRGTALAAASLASWTAFAMLNAAWLKRHPEVNSTVWANWLGVATGVGALVLWGVAGSDVRSLAARPDAALFAVLCIATGFGSAWLATVLWNVASRRLAPGLCGQLVVSETLFALAYSFAWDGRWPTAAQAAACVLFTLGILASIRAYQ